MPNSLIVFLLIIGLVSIYLIYQMVKRKRLLISHAIFWNVLIISIMIASLSTSELKQLATFIGINKVSTLIFFGGFLILLVLNLALSINISKQKSIIINLVQELALNNKRVEELSNASSKEINREL